MNKQRPELTQDILQHIARPLGGNCCGQTVLLAFLGDQPEGIEGHAIELISNGTSPELVHFVQEADNRLRRIVSGATDSGRPAASDLVPFL